MQYRNEGNVLRLMGATKVPRLFEDMADAAMILHRQGQLSEGSLIPGTNFRWRYTPDGMAIELTDNDSPEIKFYV